MTVQEENKQDMDIAISHMQVLKDWLGDSLTQKSFKESIDVAIESMEKQIPKKPIAIITDDNEYICSICPSCEQVSVEFDDKYCRKCGQKISFDWEEGGTSE